MITHDKFTFLHMPKTGGTWIRFILRQLPGTHEFKQHRPYLDVPVESLGRPTCIYIRNPWDWYQSLFSHYHHNWSRQQHEFKTGTPEEIQFLTDRFSGDILQMCDHFDSQEEFSGLGDSFKKLCETPPGGAPATILKYEDGLATTLLAFLKQAGVVVPGALEKRTQALKLSRFNAHYKYRKPLPEQSPFYAWVAAREAQLIQQFGYDRNTL